MSNEEIEKLLIQKFGLEAVILYAEMLSYMYFELYIDCIKRGLDNNELGYDYERDYWSNKAKELAIRNFYKGND